MASVAFTIPDEKWATFKEAFLEVHNVPIDPETELPIMGDNAWIKEWGRLMYLSVIRQGFKLVRNKAHPVTHDPEIIE